MAAMDFRVNRQRTYENLMDTEENIVEENYAGHLGNPDALS